MARIKMAGLVLVISGALLAGVVLKVASEGPAKAEESDDGEPPPLVEIVDSGLVVMHGEVLTGPYEISIKGEVRTINGIEAKLQDVLELDPLPKTNANLEEHAISPPVMTSEEEECHRSSLATLQEAVADAAPPNDTRLSLMEALGNDPSVKSIALDPRGMIVVTYQSGVVRRYGVEPATNLAKNDGDRGNPYADWQSLVTKALQSGGMVVILSDGQATTVSSGRVKKVLAELGEACGRGDVEKICERLNLPRSEAQSIADKFIEPDER